MKLASIEKIKNIEKHPNADKLDIVEILGFKSIVLKGVYNVGELICLIQPDVILPDKPWAAFYKAKSNRVKAIRLRGSWSQGVVEKLSSVEYSGPIDEGLEISEQIGVTKYEPPAPQDLSAKGNLPFEIPKTDQERFENLDSVQYGEIVDLTQKIDGQSISFYVKLNEDNSVSKGVLGRTMEYKLECENNYTRNEKQYDVLNKLEKFCLENKVSLCIRGESFGSNIQKFSCNPHANLPLGLALFSTWLIDDRQYARKNHPFYIFNLAKMLDLPTVPVLEENAALTPELIKKYSEDLESINGKLFEGVVVNGQFGTFKILSKQYDSKK